MPFAAKMPNDEGTRARGELVEECDLQSQQIADLPLRPASEWRGTLAKVINSVVSLHFAQVHSFDTGKAHCAQATGFVVDKEKGFILTNRHVTGTGPFWGYCTFSNHEECDVEVVYFDPVHDFAFLHFDPSAIKYADVQSLQLEPEGAQVGVEVRVVGNDSGEVLSIASAVISRLDRNAPTYSGRYHDFNTNYIQAAAVAKGGSSGSPVVNIEGHAIALQAGGKSGSSATNFFLPLHRVARALEHLQRGESITRGTIQTQWRFESFDICRRLGLDVEHEAELRKTSPNTNTMLVAERVLPEGPADGKIQKGDLLMKVNNKALLSFIEMDKILDTHVGESLELVVRRGSEDIQVTMEIGDLHAITPRQSLKVADATFHNLSYQMARYYGLRCKGIYLAGHGSFPDLPDETMIDSVDGHVTPDLETLMEVLQRIKDAKNVKIAYRKLSDLHTKASVFVDLLPVWYPNIESWTRDDDYKRWTLTKLHLPVQTPPSKPKRGTFPVINGLSNTEAAYIANTIVRVTWCMQTPANGNMTLRNTGHGIVVDAERGLVIVTRAIVLYSLCTIKLNIANIEVSAQVVFLHPLHNYAMLRYDPKEIDAPVASAKFSDEAVKLNTKVTLICVNQNSGNRTATETSITDVASTSIVLGPNKPQYRAINFDAVSVETRLASENSFGVIVGEDGLVQAMWLLFQGPPASKASPNATTSVKYGLQAAIIKPVIDRISAGTTSIPRVLDMEMRYYNINIARKHGVSEHWLEEVAKANPRHLVYAVKKLSCPPAAEADIKKDKLEETDIILMINNELVTDLSGFGALYDSDHVTATIVRSGKEMTMNIPTVSTQHLETNRAINFCGAILHQPHIAVRQLMSKLPSEIFIAARWTGSPAALFKLEPGQFITHVNDTATPGLDEFVKIIDGIPDNTFFRVRTMSQTLIPGVITIKKFDYYFPMKVFEA